MDPNVKVRQINLSRKNVECPRCGSESKRHSLGHRWLRDVGIHEPVILEVIYSKHYCVKCERHFNLPMEHLAQERLNFTNRVQRTAVDLVAKQGFTLQRANEFMKMKYHVHVPATTIHDWVATDTCMENIT